MEFVHLLLASYIQNQVESEIIHVIYLPPSKNGHKHSAQLAACTSYV